MSVRLGLAEGFCPHCGANTHDGCVAAAIAAERAACAKIAEEQYNDQQYCGYGCGLEIADAIRARGQQC